MIKEQNESKCFGTVNKYILFGGGLLLIYSARRLKELGFQVFVVTSERQSIETRCIDSITKTLLDWLDHDQIEYIISNDIAIDDRVLSAISDETIGLSFGAAWIFKQEFIDLFNGNLLNMHGAQLPKNRGGGGFSWRIMQGDQAGVSLIHLVNEGVDTGDILFYKEYIYPETCKVPLDYLEYSVKKYNELLNTFFNKVMNEDLFKISPQDEKISSYWPRLSTDVHGYINWNWGLIDIERFICAFDDPYAGASTFYNKTKVRIKKCRSSFEDGIFHPFQIGLIYRKSDDSIYIASESGSIIVNQILDDEGNNLMHILKVGDRFHTPQEFINNSMQYRAIYTPTGLKKI